MSGLLSKNVVTPREFADRKAVFPRGSAGKMVLTLFPFSHEPAPSLAALPWHDVDFIQAIELFAVLAGRQFRGRN